MLAVSVGDIAEAPVLSAGAAAAVESPGAALTIGLALSDTGFDGDETLGAVRLSGVPAAWSLTGDGAASLGGGLWSVGAASLSALELVSPVGADATDFTIGVIAGGAEGGATALAVTQLAVSVGEIAEAPVLSAGAAAAVESPGAALTIGLALSDTGFDGDETLGAVRLSGVPAAWSLTGDGAASLGGGLWSVGAASLSALELVSPVGADATNFTIGVIAGGARAAPPRWR